MSEYNYGPLEHESHSDDSEARQLCPDGVYAISAGQPRPEQGSGEATDDGFITRCVCGILSRTGLCEHLTEHDAPVVPERSEQSGLFPRYTFKVVTGRYKVIDNRSDSEARVRQIATADGEDEARVIVRALNAAEQHSTLIAQRDLLRAALEDLIRQLPTDERLADFNLDLAESVLITIEQERGREG